MSLRICLPGCRQSRSTSLNVITLLAEVTEQGYIDHYEGVRLSKTGKRFLIKNAVVWNLLDDDGGYKGQAACLGNGSSYSLFGKQRAEID